MDLLFGLALLVLLAVPLWLSLRRATERFAVDVLDGKVRLARGRCPQRLLHDLEDVVRRAHVARATIRVAVEGGKPRVLPATGLGSDVAQQLRNVVGAWSVAQIRAGKKRA